VYAQQNSNLTRRARWLAPPVALVAALTVIVLLSGCVGAAHSQHRTNYTGYAATHVKRTGRDASTRNVLTVEPGRLGEALALGAVGLSVEADELATHDLNATHGSLVALMRLLGPGVLRLGGNSVDYSWWTSSGESPPSWAKSVITPSDLAALHGLLEQTGWSAIIGVNLSHFNPARAANEAQVAASLLGPGLRGIEIGNEPDAYGNGFLRAVSYGPTNYLENLNAYSAAIRAADPAVQLYGPDLATQTWLASIASATNLPFAEITQHYYPTVYSVPSATCKATKMPEASELLSAQVRESETAFVGTLVKDGKLAHRDVRISETNTTGSCDVDGGPATSPVFASALWALDWILRAASGGVSALNFHGYFGRCEPDAVSPICAPGDAAEAAGHVIARPEYFGLLAARQLEGGHFIPVDIREGRSTHDFSAYATIHSGKTITMAIDNFSTQAPFRSRIEVPGYDSASSERLIAPSLSATGDVTFGRAAPGTRGAPRLLRTKQGKDSGAFSVELAPSSADIITLRR
jgi:hypothetical protein